MRPPRRSRAVVLGLLGVALLALAACGGRRPVAFHPATERSTTTTPRLADPRYAIPPALDEGYVQKIMDTLDHIYGDAARHALQTHQLDSDWASRMGSIYLNERLALEQQLWYRVTANGWRALQSPPGDPTTRIVRIIRAEPYCTFFEAERSFRAVFVSPESPSAHHYVALVQRPEGRNREGHNPTPWAMAFDGSDADGHQVPADFACAER